MTTQLKFADLEIAKASAVVLSKQEGYAAIIESSDFNTGLRYFYVESDTPFVRTHETLVAEYENGKQLK